MINWPREMKNGEVSQVFFFGNQGSCHSHLNRNFKGKSLVVVANVITGVGRNGEDMVNKLTVKHLEFEVFVGYSGRTI